MPGIRACDGVGGAGGVADAARPNRDRAPARRFGDAADGSGTPGMPVKLNMRLLPAEYDEAAPSPMSANRLK